MTKFFAGCTAFLLCFTAAFGQVQKGQDIDGEWPNDLSAISCAISADGNTVVIGAPFNDGNGSSSGHTRVHEWNGTAWVQKGGDIDGEAATDESGSGVSISATGNIIAIGSPNNNDAGSDAGQVRIYEWNGSAWVQLGADIEGEAAGDESGWAVSLSADGHTVAIGARFNDGAGFDAGHTRIFEWNGAAWIQKGLDIDAEDAGDRAGCAVSLSADGNTVAIGAHFNDGTASLTGHARVYEWNGSAWVQKGGDMDGEGAVDWFGWAIDLSATGNTVIVGGHFNDGNGFNAGHSRVYSWNGSAWIQKGADIDGEAAGDEFGSAVTVSADGNRIAIGAPENSNAGLEYGNVRIFDWDGSSWNLVVPAIDGESFLNDFGYSLDLTPDGNTLAAGAPRNDGNGNDAGHVRVYTFCAPTFGAISPSACNSYTAPSGNATYTASGTYADTLLNGSGCDSIIAINLTINSTSATISPTACASYTVPSGDETYTMSGTYMDTIPNAGGCDSVLTINLTISGETTASISPTACASYTVPSGDETYTVSGTYMDTIPNAGGCDSVLTINLSISGETTASISPTACASYTVPSGDETYTVSGTYMDTIPNSGGCDSVLTIILTISGETTATISPNACASYTVPSGDETYTVSGTYMDTIPNSSGCDSVLTINLTISGETTATISPNACSSYTVPSGDETYTVSGTYMDTIPNSGGCDSVLTVNLTISGETTATISPTACASYTVPSGDETYTLSGTYMDTIPNTGGCDSVLTINLTVSGETTASISPIACASYTVPSGDETYTVSGSYMDTIPNAGGCDSVLTINLTISGETTATISPNACASYTVPSGDETYTVSGTYMDTIPNAGGCDSVLTINLTISGETTASISPTACVSYTVPSGDETYTVSGSFMDTIPNSGGCDSVLTINLTISGETTASISPTACASYTVPSGDETYTVSGTFMDTIPNSGGCDSVLTINLTISGETTATISPTACARYTVPSGDETYTVSGTYMDTIPNAGGCDSVLTILLVLDDCDSAFVSVPNVFTPNGDGQNDVFTIQSSGLVELHCDIFTRWGERLASFDGANTDWSGRTFSGAEVPDGTYFYVLVTMDEEGTTSTHKGSITVLR